MRASVRHRRTGGGIFLLLQTLLFFIGSCSSFRVAPAGTRQGGARALPRAVRVRSRRRWQRPQSYRRATMQAAGGLDQDSTPLVDALANAAKNVRSPLFYPGHKMGRQVHVPHVFPLCLEVIRQYTIYHGHYTSNVEYRQELPSPPCATLRHHCSAGRATETNKQNVPVEQYIRTET